MVNTVFLGLGSNIGDRIANIKRAIQLLDRQPEIKVVRSSSLYETKPVGYLDQPDFINAVAEIRTSLSPEELLQRTKQVEKDLERRRRRRWGPRTIDVDILLFNDLRLDKPHLHLPHPEITSRAFVLVPLAEIAPDQRHPNGRLIKELLAELEDTTGVKYFQPSPIEDKKKKI